MRATAGLAVATLIALEAFAASKPNIIYILTDDVGCGPCLAKWMPPWFGGNVRAVSREKGENPTVATVQIANEPLIIRCEVAP